MNNLRTCSRVLVWLSMAISTVLPTLTWACDEEHTTSPIEYSQFIQISELLPNPSGSENTDEFIELYNGGDSTIDLTGWVLSDATSKEYDLAGSIAAGGYAVVYRSDSSIALNNSSDSVELYDPSGTVVDSIEYEESAAEDVSYAVNEDGVWSWTPLLTPGRVNLFRIAENTDEDSASDKSSEEHDDEDEGQDEETMETVPEYSDDIVLSELLPDPEGSDATGEWIEVANSGTTTVDLYGWQLADNSRTYTIADSIELAAGELYTFWVTETKISLNNSGETIQLLDPADELMDEVTYENSETGWSYVRIDDAWDWTSQPTPDEENRITDYTDEVEMDAGVNELNRTTDFTDNQENGIQTVSVLAAKQMSKGTEVVVSGVVSVLPGNFGAQYFYMQDDTSGIQVYSSKKDFPQLAVGDIVTVTGKVSVANGEPKVNISTASDIVVTDTQDIYAIQLDGYVEAQAGMVVQTSGEVASKERSTILLDSDWEVYLKRGADIDGSSIGEGEHMGVTGVLVVNDDGIRIMPRSQSDIEVLTQAKEEVATNTAADLFATPAEASNGQQYEVPDDTIQKSSQFTAMGWLGVLVAVMVTLVGLSRSELLKNRVRSWVDQWARARVAQSHHSVAAGKSTMDSSVPSQYRE